MGVRFHGRKLKYVLGWLFAGTRGAKTRIDIVRALEQKPQNANQLAKSIKKDWGTVKYHLKILVESGIVTSHGEGYGETYFLSSLVEDNYEMFKEILEKFGKK